MSDVLTIVAFFGVCTYFLVTWWRIGHRGGLQGSTESLGQAVVRSSFSVCDGLKWMLGVG